MAEDGKKKKGAVPRRARADGLETPTDGVPLTPITYKPEPVQLDSLPEPYGTGVMAIIGKNYDGYRMSWDKKDGFLKHYDDRPGNPKKSSVPNLSEIERFLGAVQEAATKNPNLTNYLGDMQKSLDKMKSRTITH